MITVEQFLTCARKGLGRAIILLKQQTDKTIYRKPLIDFITNGHYLRYLGKYETDLINCFEDSDGIQAQIIKVLLSKIEKGNYSYLCFPLLIQLGCKEALTQIVEREYQNAYTQILENLKQGNTLHINSVCSEDYFSAIRSLAECQLDEQRIKRILFDIADLYQYTNRPIVATPAHMLRNIYGQDIVYRLLKEIEEEHKHGAKLRVRFKPSIEELKKSALPITAEDILTSSDLVEEDEEFERLYVSFLMADESVIREVAKGILEEPDIKRKLHLLRFFSTAVMPDIIPPKFPLDPTPLVELAEELMPTMYQEWYTQSIEGATRCFRVLKWIRHPSVKALGKRILDDITCPTLLRNYGLDLYYGVNYLPQDRDTFVALLVHENLYNMFINLIKTKTQGAPLDMVPYIYQAIEFDALRYEFIKALIEIDALPNDIKDECMLDCYIPTRNLVKRKE